MKPDSRELWLTLPLTLAVAPLAPRLPAWLSVFWLACVLIRLWRGAAPPSQMARLLLAAAVFAGVLAQFHTILGPQGGLGFLVGMSAIKLLETKSAREYTLMALLGYFLLMTPLIHAQSLPLALYLAGVAVLLTASLIALQPGRAGPPSASLKLAGKLLLQALPVALLLFMLFPRIPAPFGGLTQARTGNTGLSDSMRPGSVSELIQSDAIALRAEFHNMTPRPDDLYWRGPVLTEFDGETWRPARDAPLSVLNSRAEGRRIEYSVTLEPHEQRWLFTLGLAVRPPDIPSDLTPDMHWLAKAPVKTRLRYRNEAYLDHAFDLQPAPEVVAMNLALPEGYNPRAAELAHAWRAQGYDGEALVRRALEYFRAEAFYYTLRPPVVRGDSVDAFLFETRRGFCEHYASAFVVLMRNAGLPARVVTGYLGGEANPIGGYWIVRQRDAHAWAEVWLPERGWVRQDPTGAVAPERVERGIGAALPAAERPRSAWDMAALRPMLLAWDSLNNHWQRWVVGYDRERQAALLARLHPFLNSLQGMLWAILAGMALLLLALFWRPPARRPARDPAGLLFERLRRALLRAGIAAPASLGPLDLARRVARQRPDLAARMREIADIYAALRYGDAPPDALRRLRALIKAFKP
jgi:transglutaminase-like putative cysteine protease